MKTLLLFAKNNILFIFFTLLIVLLLTFVAFAPYLAPYTPLEGSMSDAFQPPSVMHFLGTDKLGRDYYSRILYGGKNSLQALLILVALVFSIGTLLGTFAGYCGGKLDILIMRLSDIMISFPNIILAIAIAGMLGGSMANSILALVFVTWPKYARLARSLTIAIKNKDFISAGIVTGGTRLHILWAHIVPNILPLMVVTCATDIGALMMELSGLSFLGFGIQAPAPEWGAMINEGRQQLQHSPWLMLYPGIAIFVTIVVFNLWADTLRDVLDPLKK